MSMFHDLKSINLVRGSACGWCIRAIRTNSSLLHSSGVVPEMIKLDKDVWLILWRCLSLKMERGYCAVILNAGRLWFLKFCDIWGYCPGGRLPSVRTFHRHDQAPDQFAPPRCDQWVWLTDSPRIGLWIRISIDTSNIWKLGWWNLFSPPFVWRTLFRCHTGNFQRLHQVFASSCIVRAALPFCAMPPSEWLLSTQRRI